MLKLIKLVGYFTIGFVIGTVFLSLQCRTQEHKPFPTNIEKTNDQPLSQCNSLYREVTGDKLIAGTVDLILYTTSGFNLYITSPQCGKVLVVVGDGLCVFYQNHLQHTRHELSTQTGWQVLREFPPKIAMVGVRQGIVTDVLLVVPVEDEQD